MKRVLMSYYRLLARHFGPTQWWPGETPFEIAVGAILVQNTAWTHVERALANLKNHGPLDARSILQRAPAQLEEMLKPSGYFRVKAKRLTHFCRFLVRRYAGSMERMAEESTETLRAELLDVHGIGPETADDILLYACGKPVFVVDAYTRRLLGRHGIVSFSVNYESLQQLFHKHLESDTHLYKEYHGLIVWTGKEFCRTQPRCENCPLAATLKPGQPLRA